jgi:predicted ATP-binding protein involved in virulence
MKIRSLTLKHIGVFENETIAFPEKEEKDKAEIHILTGQNGTGKTTILQALASGMSKVERHKTFPRNLRYNLGIYLNDFEKSFSKKIVSPEQNNSSALIHFLEDSWVEILNENKYKIENISNKYNSIRDIAQGSNEEILKRYYENRINETFDFSAFAYSNYNLVHHEENISLNENQEYNPLESALDFTKNYTKNDYSLNKWLALNSSKRALAREKEDNKSIERFDRNIQNIQRIIYEIIDKPIKFEVVYEAGIKIVANIEGKKLDFDLLPDGLRSLISWIGDLLMRMDALKWENDLPVFEREFILFLDEIEVHLHPSWQRKVLPVVQKLFKNAQIFITTHSPFIVNSIDGAYIYELKLDAEGKCMADKPTISSTSKPIDEVLNEVYDIEPQQMYGEPRRIEIEDFQKSVEKAYKKEPDFDKKIFLHKAKKLADRSPELRNNVQFELRQLSKSLAEDFSI